MGKTSWIVGDMGVSGVGQDAMELWDVQLPGSIGGDIRPYGSLSSPSQSEALDGDAVVSV